jgi:hypothetical protein
MCLTAIGGRDRGREEIFEFEDAARGRHVFVGGDTRHRGFVHRDRIRDRLQIKRTQMLNAVHKERILLFHDLGRHFQDGARALIERADKPRRRLQLLGKIGLIRGICCVLRYARMVGLVQENFRKRLRIEFDME